MCPSEREGHVVTVAVAADLLPAAPASELWMELIAL